MSLSKVNIQEANSHLKQLHKKVLELENKIYMQELHVEELQKANAQLQEQLQRTNEENEAVVSELRQRLEESELRVHKLLESAQERDVTVLELEKKSRLFYEVVEHRSSIARILEVLNELSSEDDSTKEEKEDGGMVRKGGEGDVDNPKGEIINDCEERLTDGAGQTSATVKSNT